MFPSDTFSDLHLHFPGINLVGNGRSSPFDPRPYDLDGELILEHLFLQEDARVTELARDDIGEINFTGSNNMVVENSTEAAVSLNNHRSTCSTVRPNKKVVKRKLASAGSRKSSLMPRKRVGKKDRHSKIRTAQGLRDRRIRLSVHIARKFFDLQEMLGLDKASKTIEWLLAESKDAIDELSKEINGSYESTPESGMYISEKNEAEEEEEEECVLRKRRKDREAKIVCMRRESRDKARERARARMREKMMMRGVNLENSDQVQGEEINPNDITTSLDGGFIGHLPENVRDSDCLDGHEMNSLSIIEKFLGITSTASKLSSIQNFGLGDDCYGMIEEAGFQAFGAGKSLLFVESSSGSHESPNSISTNMSRLGLLKYPNSILGIRPKDRIFR